MCDCISTVNAKLKEQYGGKLKLGFQIDGGELRDFIPIATERLDGKRGKKPPTMIASHCPFCGEKYPQAEEGRAA